MIWQSQLYLLAALGGVATLVWMAEQRIYAAAGVSTLCWSVIAMTAAQIQTYTLSGKSVTQTGQWVQLVAGLLAGLSLLVIVAAYFGHYPPQEDDL